MHQLVQSLKTGITQIVEVPCPQIENDHILIQTHTSLISAGTERMLIEFGKANWLDKARQQPEKVKQVLDKIKTDGFMTTLDAVQSKLDQALPMGYSNVGVVLERGKNVNHLQVGDRVVSNGAHAEVVRVWQNLSAKIPDSVSDEEAVFTVLGAIALQGVRLSQASLGERVVVIGLGLIGLLTVQLLRAQGCQVLGLDFDETRLNLAKHWGAEAFNLGEEGDVLQIAQAFSRGNGVDAALITASTQSNEPIMQAAKMCRKRGRIVLVGVSGLELSRSDFYEKELTFQVSCSYGPGRYDANYEEKSQDYPIGFVRWTQQRNFEAFLDLLADKKVDVLPLISHRFAFEKAAVAYDLLVSGQASLGIILTYPQQETTPIALTQNTVMLENSISKNSINTPILGVIGAGNYASRVLIPAFKKNTCILKTLVSSGGISASHIGKKFGVFTASTNVKTIFQDESINAVIIATQHNTHAPLICQALAANKHVFVEKPLCLTSIELEEIRLAMQKHTAQILMVGFNRRFAPQVQKAKALLNPIQFPKHIIVTVNAGAIAKTHWTQNQATGGGRLIGEACHFIDLLRYLIGYSIQEKQLMSINHQDDQVSIMLKFTDGSIGIIHYLANGHKSYPKERIDIFTNGKNITIDNFRKMQGYGFKHFSKMNLWRQDKGQSTCATAFLMGIRQGVYPIPLHELIEVQQTCLDLIQLI